MKAGTSRTARFCPLDCNGSTLQCRCYSTPKSEVPAAHLRIVALHQGGELRLRPVNDGLQPVQRLPRLGHLHSRSWRDAAWHHSSAFTGAPAGEQTCHRRPRQSWHKQSPAYADHGLSISAQLLPTWCSRSSASVALKAGAVPGGRPPAAAAACCCCMRPSSSCSSHSLRAGIGRELVSTERRLRPTRPVRQRNYCPSHSGPTCMQAQLPHPPT